MLRARTAVIALLGVSGCPEPSQSPPSTAAPVTTAAPLSTGPSGTWRPRSFVRATEGCTQTWACDCTGTTAGAGCRAAHSRPATTNGACASDSGPLNGCDRCMALPPADACACAACP